MLEEAAHVALVEESEGAGAGAEVRVKGVTDVEDVRLVDGLGAFLARDVDLGGLDLRVVVELEEVLEELEEGGGLELVELGGGLDFFRVLFVPGVVIELLELAEDEFPVGGRALLGVEFLEDWEEALLLEEVDDHESEGVAAHAVLVADGVLLGPVLDEDDEVVDLGVDLDVLGEDAGVGDTHEVVEGDFDLELLFGVLDGEEGDLDLLSEDLLELEVFEAVAEVGVDIFEYCPFVLFEAVLG